MPNSPLLPSGLLFGFLLALARVSGLVAFLPVSGVRNAPDITRVMLALSLTLCLASSWPAPPSNNPGLVTVVLWVLSEASFGVILGLVASVVIESFQLATQIFGLQAGFSYASTIDPNSQADATILQVFAQLLASCLFFTLGLHRVLITLLAHSFQTIAPGGFAPDIASADLVIRFTGTMFSTGLRLAFPVLALLLLVDIALALLSRMQAQLQLISVAFPAKMLAGIGFFALTLWVTPAVMESVFHRVLETATRLVGR
jgi:flagellar biosynthesis protein FliR